VAGGALENLASWVFDRLDEDGALRDEVKYAVVAALEGDAELDRTLETGGGRRERPSGTADVAASEPAHAFLRSISVEGFRGIGAHATLALPPGPGLVVIAGRNGSGKSTFAEALELAITGESYRGRKKAAMWREQWRNIHQPAPCAVRVEFAVEGQGRTTIGLDWHESADVTDRSAWVQAQGQRRTSGLGSLGWDRALELYRPLLSYDELGGLLEDVPSRLFDALESFLGLEQLTDAGTRLTARVKALKEPQRTAKERAAAVRPILESLDDARARAALAELKKKTPDRDVARELITGRSEGDPTLDALARLTQLAVPSAAEVKAARDALLAAAAEHTEASAATIASLGDRDSLLAQALVFHEQHGDGPCPVCGVGTLDATWAARTREAIARSEVHRERLEEAEQRLVEARRRARQLLTAPPSSLTADGLELSMIDTVRDLWTEWAAVPESDALVADHLATRHQALAEAVEHLRGEAAAAEAARRDAWAGVVVPLASWLEAADQIATGAPELAIAEAAEKWLRANTATLRNLRLEPLADKARAIWALLRQESNVDLGTIRLEGTSTRRHVDLRARVDGDDAGALAVMSQGELHALALALFIPRAAALSSPFGFVVFDDPIQAMDPSKIDGFVQVLSELAADRQVIVFSHDDRLPETIRRTSVPARLLEITRAHGSTVRIADCLDPARRYLDDASAVAHDDGLNQSDKSRVLPGLCRFALEAACRDVFFGRQLSEGIARSDVEEAWQFARQTRQRVLLVVNPAGGNLDTWLNGKPWRRAGLGICTSAVHAGLRGDPVAALRSVEHLVDEIRSLR
jgi:energy-coupling factor transporter ATP-binding protein EcfA2